MVLKNDGHKEREEENSLLHKPKESLERKERFVASPAKAWTFVYDPQ